MHYSEFPRRAVEARQEIVEIDPDELDRAKRTGGALIDVRELLQTAKCLQDSKTAFRDAKSRTQTWLSTDALSRDTILSVHDTELCVHVHRNAHSALSAPLRQGRALQVWIELIVAPQAFLMADPTMRSAFLLIALPANPSARGARALKKLLLCFPGAMNAAGRAIVPRRLWIPVGPYSQLALTREQL